VLRPNMKNVARVGGECGALSRRGANKSRVISLFGQFVRADGLEVEIVEAIDAEKGRRKEFWKTAGGLDVGFFSSRQERIRARDIGAGQSFRAALSKAERFRIPRIHFMSVQDSHC